LAHPLANWTVRTCLLEQNVKPKPLSELCTD
jgi:hypothetical protein